MLTVDYVKLVASFMDLSSQPKVFVMVPPPLYPEKMNDKTATLFSNVNVVN